LYAEDTAAMNCVRDGMEEIAAKANAEKIRDKEEAEKKE